MILGLVFLARWGFLGRFLGFLSRNLYGGGGVSSVVAVTSCLLEERTCRKGP